MSPLPLIAICGTTGVGKSKLAVELALRLRQEIFANGWNGARILNADSMQVYDGMDVITNKLPVSARHGVEHLLMSFKKPGEQYVVGQWVHDAMQAIEETHARRQIPIVVGGTSYWIQHLIFPDRLATEPISSGSSSASFISEDLIKSTATLPSDLLNLFNNLPETPPVASEDPQAAFALHSLLSTLDPVVAGRWHWKDTRKVLRSLVITRDSGRRPSDIFSEQSKTALRPRSVYDTLCFWLYADPKSLNPRLDRRVEEMVQQGLLDEIRTMRSIASRAPSSSTEGNNQSSTEYTLGIYQSIGYREFHEYLNAASPSEKAFAEAVDDMKLSTRKYAKRQVSWIRNKLLPAMYAAQPSKELATAVAYLLDATELGDQWTTNVKEVAFQITQGFLKQAPLPDPRSLSIAAMNMLSVRSKPAK
ncbi:hypothetical protein HETIRDRAFT_309881 [Heterobasidion irregulare TC 32-1]|uniref:tRNA dimethylallyltransferase n=1 Tax=Heterobasidion irregulare (strain TC 32-1) TaxID=747525 RepID=W4KIT8_HETIT|nr:uncharacterized protein HETIRDRAFT_309881 [Heterobasidion irregulare TC 32-1]ETW85624.1 hypothetical protein HETIRDRAFT_309881 [Heterobasidion irregulare TC 32-1]